MDADLDLDEVSSSSKWKENLQRLARLLISGGTVLLREAFDIKCPPSNLPTILQNAATKKLLKAAKLTKPQWDCLYPSPGMYGKSTDFNITLLFRLLKTICGVTPPTSGWDCLPARTDHSFGADLARIEYYRYTMYGRLNVDMGIADDEFLHLWREISEALERIAGQISPAKAKEWKNAIDTFLKDPLTEEDKRHEQELQRWYQNDSEVKKRQANSSAGELKTKIEKLKESEDEVLDRYLRWATVREELREVLREFHNGTDANMTIPVLFAAFVIGVATYIIPELSRDVDVFLICFVVLMCVVLVYKNIGTQKNYSADKEISRDFQALQALQSKMDSLKHRVADLAVVYGEHSDSVLLSKLMENERKVASHGLKILGTLPELVEKQKKIHSTLLAPKLASLKQAKTRREALMIVRQIQVDRLERLSAGMVRSFVTHEMARVISSKTKREHNQESGNDRTAVTFIKSIMADEDEESTNTPQNIRQNEFQTGVVIPSDDKHKTNNITLMAMDFEAKHRECVRVLTYTDDGHVKVKLFVLSGKSGIPETLKAAAQYIFKEMDVKLEWLDLYRDVDEILKIRPLKYPSGTQQVLEDSQVDEINKTIYKNLHVLVRHRNITAVQPSLKITNSKQTGIPCITLYVLCKGIIPDGECPFPLTLGSYPVDVVDGIWFRTDDVWEPNKAQEQSEVLCLGASIGVQGEDAAGTLGAIVKDDETFYVLSCDHVMRHGTKEEIIHPALNDHLNYLNYHLQQYRLWIKKIIKKESCYILAKRLSFGCIAELEELSNKFQELKKIKDDELDKTRVTEEILETVEMHEKAFEKGLTPPRVIAKYSVGIACNATGNDGQQYYIDAALAALTPKEVESLRRSKIAKMIGTGDHPSGECSSRLKTSEDLCKSGRTTEFTKYGRYVPTSMFLNSSSYEVNAQNESLVSVLKRVRLCQSCKERSRIGEQLDSTAPPCDSCKIDTDTLCDSLWLKNCFCIDRPSDFGHAKCFATKGDSGAVLFERNEVEDLQAFGIIFGEHRNSYKRFALATPMQIALKSLSRKISKDTNLRLLSDYE